MVETGLSSTLFLDRQHADIGRDGTVRIGWSRIARQTLHPVLSHCALPSAIVMKAEFMGEHMKPHLLGIIAGVSSPFKAQFRQLILAAPQNAAPRGNQMLQISYPPASLMSQEP